MRSKILKEILAETSTPVMTKKIKTTKAKASKPKTSALPFGKKKLTLFRPQVRSRHPSHDPLRKALSLLPFRAVVRLGSQWSGDGKNRIECNSAQAVKTSGNKFLMKTAFEALQVQTAKWVVSNCTEQRFVEWLQQVDGYPIVAKHNHGSRGTGNTLITSEQELIIWKQSKTLANYIFEKFHDYSREYRLHVTKNGRFYTCRKMLREGTPEADRWYRNDSNCVWVLESNQAFDKPVNWDAIVAESVKALKAVGLDIGAIDVKVQSATKANGTKRESPKFIILETNSAPSFGAVTLEKYTAEIPKILREKFVNQ